MHRTVPLHSTRLRALLNRRLLWLTCVVAIFFGATAGPGPVQAGAPLFPEQPAITTTADGARAVLAADLDGDGDLDTLSASSGDNTVAWHENTAGDGTAWTSQAITTTAAGARAVFAADLDRDSDLDVLVGSFGDDTVAWYENTAGDASVWAPRLITTAAAGAFAVYAADVDGDGDPDVLAASVNDDAVTWYENTAGDATAWTAHPISATADEARSVFATDVDGDGDLDVLSASSADDTVAWHENTAGDGSAWASHTISTTSDGARSVTAADVDGDGDPDVLAASFEDDTVAWFENTAGDGSLWAPHTITTSADGARTVFAGDVDGDGHVDALVASFEDDTVAWFKNEAGDGTLWAPQTFSTAADGAEAVFAADVDGDGDLDALSAALRNDTIAWYRNEGSGRRGVFRSREVLVETTDGPRAVHTSDVDGDGDLDVLLADSEASRLSWFENAAGDGSVWTPRTIFSTADPRDVDAADLDGDGDMDVIGGAVSAGRLLWHENTAGDGTAWTLHTVNTGAQIVRTAVAVDMDRDGDLDVLASTQPDSTVAWIENTVGDASVWVRHVITSETGGGLPVPVDVDRDGDLDVLSTTFVDSRLVWYENTAGDGSTWAPRPIPSTILSSVDALTAADVDGDGDEDAVAGSFPFDEIRWYENSAGDGSSWVEREIFFGNDEGVVGITAADVDRDGDEDVLSVTSSVASGNEPHRLRWHENTAGDGSAWQLTTVDTEINFVLSGADVETGDLDGDGDLDVVSAFHLDGGILAWYRNDSLVIFADGFEDGDTGCWSSTVP